MNKQNYIIKSIPMVILALLFVTAVNASHSSFFFSYSDNDYAPYQANFRAENYDYDHFLGPYGHWVQVQGIGIVWVPYVYTSWRPYYYGYWVYTSYGPTWVAYEPWGWLTGHYGRWFYYPAQGWCWMPGYEWRPAWVNWATYGEYVSWSPMGPDNYYYDNDRYNNNDRYYDNDRYNNNDYNNNNSRYNGYRQNSLRPSAKVTVHAKDFTKQDLDKYIVQNQNIPNMKGELNRAPDMRFIEKATRSRINVVDIERRSFTIKGKNVEYINPAGQLPRVIEESEKIQRVMRPEAMRTNNAGSTKFIIDKDRIVREGTNNNQKVQESGNPVERSRNNDEILRYKNENPPLNKPHYDAGGSRNLPVQDRDMNTGTPRKLNPGYEPATKNREPENYDTNRYRYNEKNGTYSGQEPEKRVQENTRPTGVPVVIHTDSPRKYNSTKNYEVEGKKQNTESTEKISIAGKKSTNPEIFAQAEKSGTAVKNKKNDPGVPPKPRYKQ